ncbi:MAG: nucleoside deaminase [Gemmatimonadaceae bacterium]
MIDHTQRGGAPASSCLTVDLPEWVGTVTGDRSIYESGDERMALVITLAEENVLRHTGGPFGAAVFEVETGALVAVGVNSVLRLNNCTLHAEMVALMMAAHRRASYTLSESIGPAHELISSCEPCAMCLGATLWSGVRRLVYAATREDARALAFDEGPVFPESYRYLERRGIEIVRERSRREGRSVLELYRARAGPIYNG